MSTTKLKIKLPQKSAKSYEVLIGENLLNNLAEFLPKANRYIIVTDSVVKKLYGDGLLKNLKKSNLKIDLINFPAGEKSKNQSTKTKLDNALLKLGCGRDSLIIALGGGVVGDMAGFVAATYMRGIPYIQIPTSLLAMVDSSVGGKTGIDTGYGKNLIGAFHQPEMVIADINLLKNLPQSQFINGLIEAIKMFLTSDRRALSFFLKNNQQILARNPQAIQTIISEAIKIKTKIVSKDEYESNDRMILNFGHTIGHALETLSDYKLLHGYAVALGILVESKISELLGILKKDNYQIIENIILDLGIDKKIIKKYNNKKILKLIKLDKKSRQGQAQFILLKNPGEAMQEKNKNYSFRVEEKIIEKALKYFE